MKKIIPILLSLLLLATSCGSESKSVDVCRCLTEPENSEWNKENQEAFRDAISNEIGVENWEKVNMSENPSISEKFDALAKKCTQENTRTENKTEGIENNESVANSNNSFLIPNIGTSNGYIWESINVEAQVYATLAFDDGIFRNTTYLMNGKTNSEDFTKMLDLNGTWNTIDANKASGVIELNNKEVSWIFSEDYSTLTNNKGVIYKRIKVQ
jgi:hypothetical protein